MRFEPGTEGPGVRCSGRLSGPRIRALSRAVGLLQGEGGTPSFRGGPVGCPPAAPRPLPWEGSHGSPGAAGLGPPTLSVLLCLVFTALCDSNALQCLPAGTQNKTDRVRYWLLGEPGPHLAHGALPCGRGSVAPGERVGEWDTWLAGRSLAWPAQSCVSVRTGRPPGQRCLPRFLAGRPGGEPAAPGDCRWSL